MSVVCCLLSVSCDGTTTKKDAGNQKDGSTSQDSRGDTNKPGDGSDNDDVLDSSINDTSVSDSDFATNDGSAPDGTTTKSCQTNSECDDGFACTIDLCSAKECVNGVKGGFCLIGGKCVSDGEFNPINSCQKCDQLANELAWTNADGLSCDDNVACTRLDKCLAGVCKGASYVCDDGLACTKDECNDSDCIYETLPDTCKIDGVCYSHGTINPTISCQKCDTAKTNSFWSLVPNTCLIGGICYSQGTINPADNCRMCDTAQSKQSWGLVPNTCKIDGVCYSQGTINPAISCQKCDTAKTNSFWSLVPNTCLIGGICYSQDTINPVTNCQKCDSNVTGTSWTDVPNTCKIDGVCYSQGTFDPKTNCYKCGMNNNNASWIAVASSGCVTTFAGSKQGFLDGPASNALFNHPGGLAIDSSGKLYVADSLDNRIRVISNGQVSTFAGSGTQGFLDGPIATAQFSHPFGLAIDSSGKLYVADVLNHRIRVISNGQVSTLTGSGTQGFLDGPASNALFNYPGGLAIDSSGKLYVADSSNHRIRVISNGQVSTLAGSGTQGLGDGPALNAQFNSPSGLAIGSSGAVYVADLANHCIRVISNGQVSMFSGIYQQGYRDGPISAALFLSPIGIAIDSSDKLYVSDGHRIRLITP